MTAKIIGLVLYAVLVIFIGWWGSRKTKSFNDFMLGGGGVGPWMSAFSYGTAYFSAVLFIGFAGKIGWNFGLSGLWIAAGNTLIGSALVWFLLGKKTKRYAAASGVATLPEFFQHRFSSRFLKLFAAAAIFVFFVPYSAAVFMGLSYLFESMFAIQFEYIVLVMGVFTGFYMVTGGYRSMALIDMIFGIIMTVGVLVMLYFCTAKAGGVAGAIDGLAKSTDPERVSIIGKPGFFPLFSLVILTGVAPFAMPQLIQKFFAIKNEASIKVGMIACSFFALLISGTAYFVGALTPILVTPAANPSAFKDGRAIYDNLMPELLKTAIPEALSVVILLLILAASMSTLAALVLISGASVAKDIIGGFIDTKASEKKQLFRMRLYSALFIYLAMALALLRPSVIVTILAISWGAIASCFLGPFVLGLLWKGTTRLGAIMGGVVGLMMCIILFVWKGDSFTPQAGSIGMAASLLFTWAFSMADRLDAPKPQ